MPEVVGNATFGDQYGSEDASEEIKGNAIKGRLQSARAGHGPGNKANSFGLASERSANSSKRMNDRMAKTIKADAAENELKGNKGVAKN